MTESKTRLAISAFAIGTFVFLFGGNAVRFAVGLPAYFVLAGLLAVASVIVFVRSKPPRFRWYRLPAPLTWFLLLAALSIFWSAYRFESLLGVLAQLATTAAAITFAFLLSWHELLRTLASSMRWLLGLSLIFELWVSLFIQQPVLSWWVKQPEGKTLNILFWSRDLLFEGGPIQGLLGSSVLLGFLALVALILFSVQLRAGLVRPVFGWGWIAVAAATLLLTRSATVWVALIASAVALAFALWGRRVGAEGRMPLYGVASALIAAAIAVAVFARETVFGWLGKSSDLTGRAETWQKVWELVEQRPWFGWGWVSYWPTWVEPFDGLDTQAGMAVMSAHNAWLDVWLQLGIIGVLVFAPIVVLTLQRTWFRAIDQPRDGPGPALPYATSALWPLLVLTALIVQSLTESRMLIESGWLLLILLAVKTRFDFEIPAKTTEPTKRRWRDVPIPRGTPTS
jgi:exopolysaccharide production protein ExoQ